MTTERDLLLDSLPPEEGPAWKEFEAAFLGKAPGCPPTTDLIELAQGQANATAAARLRQHTAGCARCRSWLEAYHRGWEEDDEAPPRAQEAALLETFATGLGASSLASAAPAAPSADQGPNSVVLTGIFTMLLAGRTEEALGLLRPYLPDVLEAVGLGPGLAGQFWEFLLDRLHHQPRAAHASCPDWLRAFAHEKLGYDELPCEPRPEDWRPVIARCALRKVQAGPEETEEVRRLLQMAIDRGVTNPSYLDVLRRSAIPAGAVSGEECRRIIRKVSREEKRVARLFGLN